MANDYILYFHQNTLPKFYKRSYVQELFHRKDLIRLKETFYTLDEPAGRKLNDEVPKKLLVIFICIPDAKRYDSSLIPNRMFPKFFDGIERSLVKNVYTLRIMELNVSHGSHYISTTIYPEYEEGIQSTILKVMEEFNIYKEHVVLYGGSKGGTGALIYGIKSELINNVFSFVLEIHAVDYIDKKLPDYKKLFFSWR
ncbi:XcbB/CpsF family capsular polysaccharide biosynthesis protein [Mammaliicoccus sciuri]|uniref:XcbB/CpsF family capsular polysaccharide biosynthesis protein n=1 Tax=Mammaliicoccus sciuri TaxID=1296 RepID=UPI001EF6CA60|nr:XcbB/CpsF family capsular polysaccharide biosynthesis protein [Mammaliicoccus sciuri]